MTHRPSRSLSWLAVSLSALCGLAANAQPTGRLLWTDPDRFTPAQGCGEGLIIDGADITSIRNGTGLDGAIHFPGLFGLDFAVDASSDAGAIRCVGGRVHAPSGRVSLTQIDLSFPCAGPSWTIGRSYASGVQDAGAARVTPGYQGNNWFASAQPVLSACTDGSGLIAKLALVYGADRELRFARIAEGAAAGAFRATDGAAGVIVPVTDDSIEYFDYHDASGSVARFMGATGTAWAPAWHLVSISDVSGAVAHVEYAGGLPSVATDSAGRTFTYSYFSASGSARLACVVVHASNGDEVGRVEYTYAGANDARGLPGDLIAVRTRIPVSDQSHTIDRTWHYRYYTTAADAGRLYAEVDPEGAARAEEDQLDPSLAPAGYRDSTFTYDANGRVATAVVREMPLATLRMSYAFRTDAGGYDPTWHTATTIHTDTGGCNDLWETRYFDEAEQSLGSFAFDDDPALGTHIGDAGEGAKILAASWQERNADGVVQRLRDGANLNHYVHHASNGQVFVPDSTLGLVVDRTLVSSGLYTGFESQIWRRVGDASTAATLISAATYRDISSGEGGELVDGYLVAGPLVESSTRYQWDDTLKMYHVRHRVYDPARMLWIQRDPLGRLPGANEYAYCLGEPVDLFDPMGLNGWDNYWHNFVEGAKEFKDQFTGKAAQEDARWEQEAQNTASRQWSKALKNKNACQAQAILTMSNEDISRVRAANAQRQRKFIELYVSVATVVVMPAASIAVETIDAAVIASESELALAEAAGAIEADAAAVATADSVAAETAAAETASSEAVTAAEETYSGIGSTGKVGENALKELGGESQVYYKTSQGGRYIDQLVDGVGHESKVGYKSLTSEIKRQIAKDAELIQTGEIKGAIWHFFKSPVTGRGGPSQPLIDFLEESGINWVIE